MNEIEKKIKERKTEALRKDFYNRAQKIIEQQGKSVNSSNEVFKNADIEIKRRHYSQEWTGGSDDIEILAKGKSVYVGRGNDYTGPSEDQIDRYVPGTWEKAFNKLAEPPAAAQKKKEDKAKAELRKNWGL